MANEKELLNEELHDYLQTYAKSMKLMSPKFHIIKGSNEGDNYVGLIYRVTIEGIENGEVKNIELILKTTPTAKGLLSSNTSRKFFQREMFFYQEILPIFKETLKERSGILDLFPILYDVESEKQILMLENLTHQGFVMASSKIMDYPHLTLALRRLGEFHACSFITRAANPTDFNKFKQMEEPLFFQSIAFNKKFIDIITKTLIDEDKHYSERFRQFTDNVAQNMMDVTDGKAAEPYTVVCHGDAWTNNMLFKYGQDKNPCDLRFLDLQLCRYASPVLDLVYILFCCCTQETRSKYYDQLVNEYYETLSKCLERSGYDPNILFPYQTLREHFIKFGKYGAGMAILVIHLFTTNNGIATAYEDVDKFQNESFYKSMIKDAIKDLIDKNYI